MKSIQSYISKANPHIANRICNSKGKTEQKRKDYQNSYYQKNQGNFYQEIEAAIKEKQKSYFIFNLRKKSGLLSNKTTSINGNTKETQGIASKRIIIIQTKLIL